MTTYDLFPMNSRMVQRNLKPLFSKKKSLLFYLFVPCLHFGL